MIIKKLSLHNFRQFQGDHVIEFSTDESQNITLILGDNTSGKTTLLQSFLWCFYGAANFKSKDSLLSSFVAQQTLFNKETADIKVAIELEHQGIDYTIERSLMHYVTGSESKGFELKTNTISKVEMHYKTTSGGTDKIPPHQIQNKINEILPEDLAIYFLYDTERFGNITSKADVTNSVKGILGLTVLDNMIKHLGSASKSRSVLGQLNSNLNLEGNKKAAEAYKEFTEAEEKRELIQERIAQKNKEIEAYQKAANAKKDILRSLENTAQLQADKDKKLKFYNLEKNTLNDAQTQFYNSFKNNTHMFLGFSLFQKALNELSNTDFDKTSIRDMNANSIKDIIERGICVCGTKIENESEAYKHLTNEMRYLPPESIGTIVKYFKEKLNMSLNTSSSFYSQLENCYKNILASVQRLSELEDEIQYLNDELEKYDSVDKHQEVLLELEAKIATINKDIAHLNQELGITQKTIKENKDIYAKNIQTSDRNNELLGYIGYAEEILNWVTSHRDNREKEIKEQLEDKVNTYFSKMYHGNRKVTIDKNFRVNLVTTDLTEDIHTDESQGLETVKNFAFISGLVDLAKEKLKNAYEKDAESYPLILDAPFSNADEKHVKNISEVLPNVANQLIFIIMAKDWNYAEKSLSNKVGKEYYLDKQSEISTKIKEVNKI